MQGVKSEGAVSFNPMLPETELDFDRPTFIDSLGAAFRVENDVYAAWQLLNRPQFEPDEAFKAYEHGPTTPNWITNSEELSRAQSLDEFNWIEQRVLKDAADRQEIMANGTGLGILASSIAGLSSPTSLIPLTTTAKGAKGMRDAFALAAAASTAQEGILYAEQETRSGSEVAWGIGGGTVLGGLLGSAAVLLRKGDVSRVMDDMAGVPTRGTVVRSGAPSALEALPDDVHVKLHNSNEYIPRRADYQKHVEDYLGKEGLPELNLAKAEDLHVPIQHIPEKFPELHMVARDVDPQLFNKFDVLLTRKQVLEKLVVESKVKSSNLDTVKIKTDLDEAKADIKEAAMAIEDIYDAVAFKDLEIPKATRAKKDYLEGKTTTRELVEETEAEGQSLSAASRDAPVHGLMPAPNRVSSAVANTLAHISGVGRTLKQQTSPVARQVMAKFHDAGIFLDTRNDPNLPLSHPDNADIRPSAAGGTITHRRDVHETATARVIQKIDDAYARYVYDDTDVPAELRNSTMADIRSGTGTLPEGKMSRKEWDTEIFDMRNKGQTSDNPHTQKGLDAIDEFYKYFREVHDEAWEEVKLKWGTKELPLIPEDANLGKDVEEYLNHVYDTRKVNAGGSAFQDALTESAEKHLTAKYLKELDKLRKSTGKLDEETVMLATPTKGMTKEIAKLDAEIKRLEAEPDMQDGVKYLTDLRAQLRAAKATPEESKIALAEAREGLGQSYNSLTREWAAARAMKKSWEEAKGRAPKSRKTRTEKLRKERNGLEDEFEARWRKKGAEGSETTILKGEASLHTRALDDAQELQHNIRGNKNRVAGMDIIGGERGPELARSLDMPFDVKKQFLVTNLEQLMRIYSRHMAADLEIWRATGSVNGARAMDEVKLDLRNAEQKIMNATTMERKGKQVPITAAQKERDLLAFHKAEKQIKQDFQVVIDRIRHTRAANMDTDSWTYRLGTLALNLNVTRSMGTVVTSSISDVGRPVMMFGLTNTFRHGWGQYIQGLIGSGKGITREELMNYGIGLDPVLHNRAQAIFEMMDVEPGRQSFVEKGAQFFANKTGAVALFDRWTAEMKFIAGTTAVGTVADAMKLVAKGGTGKRVTWAKTLLADGGLDAQMITRIQKQLNAEGGSQKIGGLQLPNTKAWTDMEAISAYRQMINKFTNDAIITPGPDRPNWMDASIGFRMLSQFRTFNMTATNRTMIRGLQQSDMAVLNGVMVSLAMGGLSYYTWAMTVGGKAKAEMLKGDPETWAYQAVSRSGLLAVLAEPQRIGENVPALQDYAMFGGKAARTRRASSVLGAALGPSFDLAERISKLIVGIDDPTKSTLHQGRTLMAYQNVFYLRQLFDVVEQAAGDMLNLPDKRGQ